MELLGDSLVQWVVTDYLYQHFPEHNRNIQAQIAGEIGLDQHVHFGVGPVSIKKVFINHFDHWLILTLDTLII